MAQQNAEQEPTMEEILASIRRIINEDEEGDEAQAEAAEPEAEPAPEPEAAAEPEPTPEPEPAPEPEAAAEPEPEPAPEPEPEPEAADEDVLELTDRVEEEGAGTDPMAMSDDLMIVDREQEEAAEETAADEESLLGESQADAASAAFAALSENLRVSSENGQTLEGIVRELMKPMLKQWLDENLPTIVEQKVQEEIERVARRRR